MAELLRVENLRTYFFSKWGTARAVDGVSFTLDQGETLGIVGESGCGKTMTALSILRLVPKPAARIVSGKILFDGEDLLAKSDDEMRRVRGKCVSMILQDPMTALNPVLSIGDQLGEGIAIHQKLRGALLREKAKELLRLVRIPSPELRLRGYPHEMSGGMRQRVVGAISISCEPRLLIADEATTALDMTVQAQYLALLKEIQQQRHLSLIFVTHDFGIVAMMCDRVAVMYAGKIVEMADVRDIFNYPKHPYTIALLNSVPSVDGQIERLASIEGQPPALYDLPQGCSFFPRCSLEKDSQCAIAPPTLRETSRNHTVSCWK